MQFDTSQEALRRDTLVEFYRSGGPGGQHKNKTETAVRLRHEASGVVVTASEERSRIRNIDKAFERLAERLEKLNYVPKTRRPTRPTLGSQRRRTEAKTRRSTTKQLRGKVRHD